MFYLRPAWIINYFSLEHKYAFFSITEEVRSKNLIHENQILFNDDDLCVFSSGILSV